MLAASDSVNGTVSAAGDLTVHQGTLIAYTVHSTAGSIINAATINASTVSAGVDVSNSGTITAASVSAERDFVNQATGGIIAGRVTTTTLGATVTPVLPNFATADGYAIAGTPFTVTIAPTGGVAATSGNNLMISAGRHVLTEGTVQSTSGNVSITALSGSIAQTGGLIRAGGGAGAGSARGALTFNARAGGSPLLYDDPSIFGYILQSGGRIQTATLTGAAARSIRLDQTTNEVDTLGTLRAGVAVGSSENMLVANLLALTTSRPLLTVAGEVSAGRTTAGVLRQAGGSIRLTADDMEIAGAITAPDASAFPSLVQLQPLTARAVTLGGSAVANTLSLETTELSKVTAGTLTIGSATTSATTSGISITGNVSLRPAVTALRLDSSGDVTQSAGILEVQQLNVQAPSGKIDLRSLNKVDEVAVLNTLASGADHTYKLRTGSPAFSVALRDLSRPGPAVGATGQPTGMIAGQDSSLTIEAGRLLTLTAPSEVGNGKVLTLRADDLALTTRLAAPAGTLQIRPTTSGRTVTLGVDASGTLALNADEIMLLGGGGTAGNETPATMLRIGTDIFGAREKRTAA
jgi:filamentous hemagglutinin